jgi:DNA-binding response OmpR family regulator
VTAKNGREALRAVNGGGIDLILLDIMMPEMDGIQALVQLRESENLPVILLTAKSEDADKILGLNLGADDYVTKPFHPAEVLARVRSQLRRYLQLGGRGEPDARACFKVGGIELDERSGQVWSDGAEVALTPTEYDILRLFLQHPDEVLSPKEIYRRVWKDAPFGAESTVAVHIRHLREKIEINPAEPRYLKVVWGKGYKLESGARAAHRPEGEDA